ncbi:MAG: protein-methionine-sulfoxide reductase catalytic subunit MsrP [Elioraea sp.]|nr:protein-methionine-sulfoxide reductase catalytic subunit MsrP [Elioraea sp.]
MKPIRRHGWEIKSASLTPERVVLERRGLLAAAATLAIAPPPALAQGRDPMAWWDAQAGADPTRDLYPAPRSPVYPLDRPLTEARHAIVYNNFYEFGSHKDIWRAAQRLETRPWTVTIDGLVPSPRTVDIDDLVRRFPLEERTYRFRCVEAWAMAVPWVGFPLAELVRWVEPLGSARYVVFESFHNPRVAPGFRQTWYPWPYREGFTMAEAMNELSLVVVGIYGRPLPPQMGAPLRVITPWKYGFKQPKSVVRISFTDRRPVGFWERLQPNEYGFWANVNPAVPHPRWSQATERMLGSDERRPTLIWNGYGEWVAALYQGLQNERLFA